MRVHSKKEQKTTEEVTGGTPRILVEELLDASGSMNERHGGSVSKYNAAEEGINLKINALKHDTNAEYIFGVTEFDTDGNGWNDQKIRYTEPIKETPIANVATFKGRGPGNQTPLYEAVAKTIRKLLAAKKPEDRVLLSIYTDGDENASRDGWSRHDGGAKKLYDLMEDVKKNHKFTITFVGTKFDVETAVRDLGLSRGNTYTYDGTSRGMKMSMHANVGSTMRFAEDVKTRGVETSEDFYTKSVEEETK